MEFGCSGCEYISYKKSHVTRHINKTKSCSSGKKEIIEIPIDINCEYCNKEFSTKQNMKDHVKNDCKQKEKILKDKIKKLEEEVKNLKETKTVNIDNSVNTTNNTTNYIFVLNNYEDTNLDKITDKLYNKLINNSETYQIIPSLIKHIHFNKENPENHNVFISNRGKNNKHLQIRRNGQWEIANKSTEIENIISDKETNLSDWIDSKGEKYPEAVEKYQEYLEQKYEPEIAELIKEEVELALYNGRHMIKPSI
jgi:hypothetical protein